MNYKVNLSLGGFDKANALPVPVAPAEAAQATSDPFNGMMGPTPTPIMTAGLTFKEIGNSGLRAYSGWVREEFLPQLLGRQAAQKYREMMDNSPVIGAIMFAIVSTMRKVQWRCEPANDSAEAQAAADFAESLRDDMSHPWEDFITEVLSMLGFGFAPHEIVYKRRLGRNPGMMGGVAMPASKYDDGMIGWRRLPLRGQETVLKWFFDQNGVVQGMTQQPFTGPIIDLPIEKMLLFRPSAHKNNPEGRSILRTAYIPYYFIKRLQEQEAILFERLNGIPVITAPMQLLSSAKAGNPESLATVRMFEKIVSNLRIDEQMGLVLPSDPYPGANGTSTVPQYDLKLVTPQSGRMTVNAHETIGRYSTNIFTSVMADFLLMGHDTRGAQNLGETKADMFFLAIESYMNSIASVVNRYGLARIWELNGLNPDLMPNMIPDLAQRVDLDVLSNFVLRMSQSGMPLFPDEELQTYLRDTAGLPDATDPMAMDMLMEEHEAATAPPPPPGGKPGGSNFEKMLMASVARRMIKHGGPKFGVHTRRPQDRKQSAIRV